MMKKLISAILFVSMILTMMPQIIFASSAASDAVSESAVLFELGVTDYEKATDASVTRAAFTRYAMKLADISVTPHVGAAFDDVPTTHPDYNFIMSAVDFGLISSATSYRPDDYVTLNEASKILIKLLGYDYMAEAKGGYPYGYMQTAQSLDVFDGITYIDGPLSQANAAIILCNALHVRLPEITYTADGASAYTTGTATILGKYRDMSFVNGKVDGTPVYAVSDEDGLGEGRMSIDGTVYNSGKINTVNLFGCNVDAYIDNKTNTVISCQTTDVTKVFSLYAEDVLSYESRKFTYEDVNGKVKTVSIAPDAYVFYNGKLFDFDSSKLIPSSGSLTFVSDGARDADVLYVKSYKTTVVDRISTTDYIISDKYSKDNNITLDPDKTEYTIVSQDGKNLDFNAISQGDVLCSAISEDGTVAEVVCVRDKIIGTFSGQSDNYIQVDGTSYRLNSSLVGMVGNLIQLGKEATFYLDVDQRVADIIPASSAGENIGYLFWGRYSQKGMSQNMYARIMSLDGTKAMYTFSDTFTINGNVYKDCKVGYDAHKSPDYNSLLCGMVKFRLDSEGKLKSLTYSDKQGGDGGLYVTQTVEQADEYHTYQQWFNNVGLDIICDTSLKIFKVPNPLYSVDSIDEDNYSVEEPKIIDSNNSALGYKLEGYTTNANDGLSKYLLMQKIEDDYASGTVDLSAEYPYMVSSIKKVFNNEEPCEALELVGIHSSDTGPAVIYSYGESDFSDAGVKPGDIIRYDANEKHILNSSKAFDIVYKRGSKILEGGSYSMSAGGRVSSSAIYLAFVNEFRKDVAYAVSLGEKPEDIKEGQGSPIYMPNANIYKYDEKQGRVISLSVNDIKDYQSFGSEKTTIIYHRVNYSMQTMFIVGE